MSSDERLTIREQIVDALRDGFGGTVERVETTTEYTLVYVADVDEPIKVLWDDVIVPDALRPAARGIMLDVLAILADNDVPAP